MKENAFKGALQGCSFHALLMLVSKALSLSGCGDVQILDRRESRQKSRFGGHELVCKTRIGMLSAKIIVKVINDAVRLRMMDEMAGAILRTKADLGLIITPHHITRTAKNQQALYGVARVEVLDGNRLAAILMQQDIGVRGKGEVDYAFFGGLEFASQSLLRFLEEQRK